MTTGHVLALLDGEDAEPGTEYQVEYVGDGTFMVDHLLEDFLKGELEFCKIYYYDNKIFLKIV